MKKHPDRFWGVLIDRTSSLGLSLILQSALGFTFFQ
jgi:hypothetical protein